MLLLFVEMGIVVSFLHVIDSGLCSSSNEFAKGVHNFVFVLRKIILDFILLIDCWLGLYDK